MLSRSVSAGEIEGEASGCLARFCVRVERVAEEEGIAREWRERSLRLLPRRAPSRCTARAPK